MSLTCHPHHEGPCYASDSRPFLVFGSEFPELLTLLTT